MSEIETVIYEATLDHKELIHTFLLDCGLITHGVLAEKTRYWYGITSEGEIVATAGMELGGEALLLRSVAVHPLYRRQGWGIKIVNHILELAKELGYRYVYLFSTEAGDYWIKQGFYEVSVYELAEALPDAYQVTRLQKLGRLATDAAWKKDLVT